MSRFISAAFCALFIFSISSVEASAAYNPAAGKSVYETSCTTCHKDGIMGAPKVGDKAVWAPRIAQGEAMLVSKSIKGFTGKKGMMPAKGGNPKLTDTQVGNAVAYMVKLSK
ncbi:MAG: cytochrome c5 family protein [Chlorobium sp.]|nr:MAG: cytochrome c5 family protein [Chlorobium sp.]